MKEKFELYQHIYQDSEMSCYTITKLLDDLKDKDNKIKGLLEEILKGYEVYRIKSSKVLKKNKAVLEPNGFMPKMMASMGIKKEVRSDNSDSSMADLMLQGVSMGSINMEKKIKDYSGEVGSDELKFAKKFLKFQQESIEKLKFFL